MIKWISVKNQLPDQKKVNYFCLVWKGNCEKPHAVFQNPNINGEFGTSVTHWAEINAPEELNDRD